jgi:hypothetical protein
MPSQADVLASTITIPGALASDFELDQIFDHCEEAGVFHLPAHTMPGSPVRGRGGPFDVQPFDRKLGLGILPGLSLVPLDDLMPLSVLRAIRPLANAEVEYGQTWVGRPTENGLLAGWFETWMLAGASLIARDKSAAFRPVLSVLGDLREIRGRWDSEKHPVLDASVLFIPDLQLDCGPWGELKPADSYKIEKLLEYRRDYGKVTVVGVQNHNVLRASLKRLLIGEYDALEIGPAQVQPVLPRQSPPHYRDKPVGAVSWRELGDDARWLNLRKM